MERSKGRPKAYRFPPPPPPQMLHREYSLLQGWGGDGGGLGGGGALADISQRRDPGRQGQFPKLQVEGHVFLGEVVFFDVNPSQRFLPR